MMGQAQKDRCASETEISKSLSISVHLFSASKLFLQVLAYLVQFLDQATFKAAHMRTIGFEWNRSNFCVGLQVDEMNRDVKAILVVINHIREFDIHIVSGGVFVAPGFGCGHRPSGKGFRLAVFLKCGVRVVDHGGILFSGGITLVMIVVGAYVNPSEKNAVHALQVHRGSLLLGHQDYRQSYEEQPDCDDTSAFHKMISFSLSWR